MCDRVADDLPKTNNHVEGWHRKMLSTVTAYHPNIWRFLDVLKNEMGVNNVVIMQMLAGHPPPQ